MVSSCVHCSLVLCEDIVFVVCYCTQYDRIVYHASLLTVKYSLRNFYMQIHYDHGNTAIIITLLYDWHHWKQCYHHFKHVEVHM